MQRKQFLVKLKNEDEGNRFIKYLEYNGFVNVHKISFNDLRVKVLVAENKQFFSTNVTCLAALAGYGIKPMSTDEFKSKFELEFNIVNGV